MLDYYDSLMGAVGALLITAGYSAEECGTVDIGQPLNQADRAPRAPAGCEYACTYPVVDDLSPGVVHTYVNPQTRQRRFQPVIKHY
jgi:hypothetical protein